MYFIDISRIYFELKETIETRITAQEKQKELWQIVKRTSSDVTYEMDRVTNVIKDSTYRLDKLIGQLSKYKQRHSAMKLAYDYLNGEISRVQKIIDSREGYRDKVRRGESRYIYSDGSHDYSPNADNEYIQSRYNRLTKLKSWRDLISNYL
jgi:hypothetical protein